MFFLFDVFDLRSFILVTMHFKNQTLPVRLQGGVKSFMFTLNVQCGLKLTFMHHAQCTAKNPILSSLSANLETF